MSRAVCIAAMLICAPMAFSQTPAAPQDQNGTGSSDTTTRKRPLTPEEERQRQIRLFDPLDKSLPKSDDDTIDSLKPETPNQTPASQDLAPATPRSRSNQPLPGSVAAGIPAEPANPRRQGPEVVDDAGNAPVPEYTGPAVLSRSYTIARPMVPQTIKWTPSFGFGEVWDTGLVTGSTANGGVAGQSSLGTTFNWGISGRHFWKRDQLGLQYASGYYQYRNNSTYSGANQTLSLDYGHQFSRRFALNVVSGGSIYSANYGLENQSLLEGTSVANINLAASPAVQLLDQGTRQFNTQVSGTYRLSYRLSFSGSGGVFFVQRSSGLYGNTGYQAQGDVNYRLSRKMTVGAYYSFTNYVFSQRINIADFHTVGGIFSYAFSRRMELRLRAGLTRLENAALQTVQLPPLLVALLGQDSAVVETYSLHSTSDISAQFARDFGRNGTASLAYAHGISPGNGLQLTSKQESISASFTTRLFRTYGVSFGVGRATLIAEAQNLGASLGSYRSDFASVNITRPWHHNVNSNFGFDYRRFQVSNSPILQNQLRISTGISWSPEQSWLRRF